MMKGKFQSRTLMLTTLSISSLNSADLSYKKRLASHGYVLIVLETTLLKFLEHDLHS